MQFEYGVTVKNVLFHFLPGKKVAHQIVLERGGKTETIDLTENDCSSPTAPAPRNAPWAPTTVHRT